MNRRLRALLAAVLAIAALVVLLATGAFSGGREDKPQVAAKTTATAPTRQIAAAPLLGTWQGTATQTPASRVTNPAEVRLTITGSNVGKVAGTLSEKAISSGCGGGLKLMSTGASYVFRYDADSANPTGCVPRTTVTVTPAAGGDIDFYEVYTEAGGNMGTVVGRLKRSEAKP